MVWSTHGDRALVECVAGCKLECDADLRTVSFGLWGWSQKFVKVSTAEKERGKCYQTRVCRRQVKRATAWREGSEKGVEKYNGLNIWEYNFSSKSE